MASFNVELNGRANKDGLYTVFIRVTENRKSRKIKLSFRVSEAHFNKNALFGKWIRMANSKHKGYNKEIEDKIDELKAKFSDLKKTTLPAIDFINKEVADTQGVTLKFFFDKFLAYQETVGAVGYYRQFKSKLTKFQDHFKPDTLLTTITTQHISEYKTFLIAQGTSGVTVNDNLRRVRTAFNHALDEDLITKDPFRNHTRVKAQSAARVKLSDEKITEMAELALPDVGDKNWKHNTRNYYLFAYYNAGIRVSDLMQLRYCNLIDGRLEYEMDKTGHKKSIQLNAAAMGILNEYLVDGADPKNFIFPILDNNEPFAKFVTREEKRSMPLVLRKRLFQQISSKTAQINNNLALISTALKLEKSISFHTARHSFADKARRAMKNSNKITLIDVMNALGHKKLVTTQIYMNSHDKDSLDEAMGDIFK